VRAALASLELVALACLEPVALACLEPVALALVEGLVVAANCRHLSSSYLAPCVHLSLGGK
jgi:hypothetical protein